MQSPSIPWELVSRIILTACEYRHGHLAQYSSVCKTVAEFIHPYLARSVNLDASDEDLKGLVDYLLRRRGSTTHVQLILVNPCYSNPSPYTLEALQLLAACKPRHLVLSQRMHALCNSTSPALAECITRLGTIERISCIGFCDGSKKVLEAFPFVKTLDIEGWQWHMWNTNENGIECSPEQLNLWWAYVGRGTDMAGFATGRLRELCVFFPHTMWENSPGVELVTSRLETLERLIINFARALVPSFFDNLVN